MDMQKTIWEKGGFIMRKGWKTFLMVCGIVAGVGMILCCVAVILGASIYDMDIPNNIINYKETVIIKSNIKEHHMKENEFANIDNLKCELKAGEFQIIEYDGEKIKVKNRGNNVRVYVEDGKTLTITSKHRIIRHHKKENLDIYVPRGMQFKEVEITLAAGSLDIENINARSLGIDVAAGKATIRNCNTEQLDVETGAGEVDVRGNIAREAEFDTGVGTILFQTTGKQEDFNYLLECGVGEIQLGEKTYSGFSGETNINNHKAKEINIDCGVGSVRVLFQSEQL